MSYLSKWLELSPSLHDAAERASELDGPMCPAYDDIFKAFSYFEPRDTRVVVLGQDPYHSTIPDPDISQGQQFIRKASGLAFGYNKDWLGRTDSSLANILAELGDLENYDRSLEQWAKQGVLLLNTRLTVQAGKPMSHAGIGLWEQPIATLLQALAEMHRRDIVWMCWGAEAQKATEKLKGIYRICTSHPCKFSNRAGSSPFTGSNCFERANEYLHHSDREPINWTTNEVDNKRAG